MDGFDDLLASSRRGLEDNPFADPFGKRSDSPDPWASPFASGPSADTQQNDPFTSPPQEDIFASKSNFYEAPYEAPYESPSASQEEEQEERPAPVPIPTSTDPLDSANVTKDDDEEEQHPTVLRSPGFRESVTPTRPTFAEVRGDGSDSEPVKEEPFSPESPTNILKSEQEQLLKQQQQQASSTPSRSESPAPPFSTPGIQSPGFGSGSRLAEPSPLVNTLESGNEDFSSPLGAGSASATLGLERSLAGFGASPLGGGGGWGNDDAWGVSSAPAIVPSAPVTSPPSFKAPESPIVDDDSEDDKPIGQIRKLTSDDNKGKAAEDSKPAAAKKDNNNLQPVFVITVDDPQKIGDPIRAYTMYTVHTRTTSPMFQKSAFSVLRRYSDFLWLYETLWMNNPGVVVPPVPEKSSFGRFDDQFVKQRRMALQKCIQKMANHPVLMKDPDLKFFLESDTFALDVKHRKAEIAHERGGLMASLGQTIAGPRFHETDDWFDRQKVYLDSLESQLRGLVKAIEAVSKQRNDLAAAIGDFANAISELSEADVGKQLSHSLSGLANVHKKAQELQVTQSDQDLTTLMATVEEYARLINSVRMSFSSRIRTYHTWKTSESDLLKTKQNHEKNKAQGKVPTDRLSYSLAQIAEAERRALESKYEYEHVTKLVKTEMSRFEQERIEDFKDSLHAFLEGMISRQKELISAWENYQHMLLRKIEKGPAPAPAAGDAASGQTVDDDSSSGPVASGSGSRISQDDS